jgi:uncharacterized repeat protein (TIGR03803 family)
MPALAQTYTVLHSFACFPNDGQAPLGSLVQDSAGNIYGTTYAGGAFGWGTVYEITPSGTVTILHSFNDSPGDGVTPRGGVVRDGSGNLYGTTEGDEATDDPLGSVFKLTPDGVFTLLHSFAGNVDGSAPWGLIQDQAGNLYGTTAGGGPANAGTVFRISPDGQRFAVLTDFPNGGGDPTSGLSFDRQGNLYGMGGASVFRLDAGGVVTILHTFTGSPDGLFPFGGVTMDKAGNLYGTTLGGGVTTSPCDLFGCGTVFKIDPQGNETVLYSFTGKRDGSQPVAATLLDSSGNLYTTAQSGGIRTCTESIYGCGTAIEISQTGKVRVLHAFAGGPADGSEPMAPLLRVGNILYGTTYAGGAFSDCGTIFKQTLPGAG